MPMKTLNIITTKPLLAVFFLLHRPLTVTSTAAAHPQLPPTPINRDHLLRICTILYQQQHCPFPKLHRNLLSVPVSLTPEFFLQVCNSFPFSWRPVHNFFLFTQSQPHFQHIPATLNKYLDVVGKSRNIDLFWELLNDIATRRMANYRTLSVGLKTLAKARELKKCVGLFHLLSETGWGYGVESLNAGVEILCGSKLVEEAKYVAGKMRDWVRPDGVTYKHLVIGFCKAGDLVEASKLWNLMLDEGLRPEMEAMEVMIETFFKKNQYDEAMKLFNTTKAERKGELGLSTYRLVLRWLCKRGKIEDAYLLLDEMREKGIQADNPSLASVIYGLLIRSRIREAYKTMEGIEQPDINIYHGFIKGFLRLKKARDATEVFREMIRRRCEPTMHTYIMLLQGHMGRRGRKGKDPLVNFDTIFVGGLVKAGKSLEVTKYVERVIKRGVEVPRFDYNKFLHYFSNDEGVFMFAVMAEKLREVGSFDLADIFERYGEKMATRDRRRRRSKAMET